ncbi:Clavaminate synthase-like protein [Stemphylium lycopersici]|uniref:Clavaminate synthase-like protein n=1 Tax=Stemphylium lycopersici TaxID=183478 RepID=A0A364NE67_STELY|nr:Clavaminate synthase-like protein [Stemphylium lycopersici]
MASNITSKLPARNLRLKVTSSCRIPAAVQRRRFFFHSFWRSPKPAERANWSPATHGPFTPTRHREQLQQQAALKYGEEQSDVASDASDIGQLDGIPAKSVSVNIDGDAKVFDAVFLRDSCPCPRCMDPDSKNKRFQTSDIPEDIEGSFKAVVDEQEGDSIEVEWKSDVKGFGPDHRTRHSIDWLRRAFNTEVDIRGGVRYDDRVFWDNKEIVKANKWLDYDAYMTQDRTLFEALTHLNRYGLLFIKNVPESEESVVSLASRVGTLKDTFYGRTWDVRSKPKAENIAYTPDYLGLHMDLLYLSNPPHLQFLHSLRARTPGGESFFSDAFAAAHQLREQSESHFRTLCTFPVTYHYHHPTFHYHLTRPVIEMFPSSKNSEPTNSGIRRINWSPPFQAPFQTGIGSSNSPSLRSFIAASNAYERLLSAQENLYEYRLNEGECVIFDNRRVLHARKAFDASKGERWLKGAYVDDDVFFSQLRVLQEKFEGKWVADGVVRHAIK